MGFESLLGNEQLKENLRMSVGQGKISHFYLISGPAGSGKRTLARLLSAAILCQGAQKPCLSCNACRKVLGESHPDCISVTDPDHKQVAVKIVRDARADMYIRPNEGSRKIYIFPQELGVEGQNALLKILEEPPPYGVFILLSDNPEKLLPTVRSRCTELRLLALPEKLLKNALLQEFPDTDPESLDAAIIRSGGYLGQAKVLLESGAASPQTEAFAAAFARRDALGLLQVVCSMEKWKRDQAIGEWQSWLQLLQSALVAQTGNLPAPGQAKLLQTSRSPGELMRATEVLQEIIPFAQGNVSVAAICGYLQWALR